MAFVLLEVVLTQVSLLPLTLTPNKLVIVRRLCHNSPVPMHVEPADSSGRSRSGGGWLIRLLIILLLVYPLSFGPAFKLVFEQGLPREVLVIYEPIVMLSGYEPVGNFFVWYLYEFWQTA